MLLNTVEKALMNNPVRAMSQRWFEAPRLRAMGGAAPGARALELGCGCGVGTELVLDVFGARHVDAFRAMRVLNPSPYMYFLDLPPGPGERTRTQIAGASPETLVRLEGGTMTVRPLAGTRPRGKTPEEDEALGRELLADPKERAEHVMLIDLGRNDVGRVAEVGTVKLVRQMEIERYSHVTHIVSEVTGRVPAGTCLLYTSRCV